MTTTPFPLGYFVGAPDSSNATAEAKYQSDTQLFEQTLGATPQFIDSFIDTTQLESSWVTSAQFQASSTAQSPVARTMTPVIGLPMASSAATSPSADQMYKNFAAGSYDDMLRGIVKAWSDQGFKTQYWRPGWEMNLAAVASYAGSDAGTQADYVAAFQHIYTMLHAAGAADGVDVKVVWMPGVLNYSAVGDATQTVYPGSNYVDVIGADVYSDVYPYGSPNNIYDYSTGQTDSSIRQWAANPANLYQYFQYPAQTQYSLDGSLGHSLTLQTLLDFAKAQGKPFAIGETGAGATGDGTGILDDPTFVRWLATTLTNSGVPIDFVNIWDSIGGGTYPFSSATDNKPLEASAWANFFGAQAPAVTTLGSGRDTIGLTISEDAWLGNAQFTIAIDGTQIGGVQTALAQRYYGNTQLFNMQGNFGAGNHVATVNFLNDAYYGTPNTDRNLYVTAASANGVVVPGATLSLGGNGQQSLAISLPSTSDTLDLHVSEDAFQGDAQFTVSIDGSRIGGVQTATASHAAGASQDISLTVPGGPGAHTIGISFINDAYGGTAQTDRNLYVDQVSYDGQSLTQGTTGLLGSSTAYFAVSAAPAANSIGLRLSEDAYLGDAQYTVSIDGATASDPGEVTAVHDLGQSQAVTITRLLTAGPHDLAVSFLNDAYGGSPSMDRNLYLDSLAVDGIKVANSSLVMGGSGTYHLQFVVPPH